MTVGETSARALLALVWALVGCTGSNPSFQAVSVDGGPGPDGREVAPGEDRADAVGMAIDKEPVDHPSDLDTQEVDQPPAVDAQELDYGMPVDAQVADGAPSTPADLLEGLVGYWRMDETNSATARDSSGLGNHGRLENLDPAGAWTTGKFGRAINFGTDKNAGIEVTATARIAGLTRYTVAAWARRIRLRPLAYQSIISRQLSDGIAEVFDLSVSRDRLHLYGSDRTASGAVTSAIAVTMAPVNEWFHAAATFDGQTLAVYQNGKLEDTRSLPKPLPASNRPLYLGTNKNESGISESHHPWEGQLDEILLYDVVLSAEAIAALARGERPPVP